VAGRAAAVAGGAVVVGGETGWPTGERGILMASFNGRHVLLHLRVAVLVAALTLIQASAAVAEQRTFATPEKAVDALVAAVRAGSTGELLKILGPASRKLVRSGNAVEDARARAKFITAYDEANRIDPESDTRAVLDVGKDDWSFPFPIVRRGEGWQFDAAAGAEEILERRIGRNELDAIEVCRAYVDAQREYAEEDRNKDGFVEYAQKFLSSPGARDGLYWPAAPGEEESPIGPLMASARAEGYSTDADGAPRPYHGYYYRILKAQGAAARDGAYDYVVDGHMIGGFALVAFPAEYRVSGVTTFIVNHDGIVYQKDLGQRTGELARKMTRFDPDPSWTPAP
jgi:Protein of unknown function (DUF2950)